MTTTATLAGLSDRLREQAGRKSDASKMIARAKSLRQPDNPERRDDLYMWETPEQTLEWQAATEIEALLARIAALESENAAAGRNVYRIQKLSAGLAEALEKISDQPNTGLIASVVEAKRIARAALTLKENDDAKPS